MHARTCLRFGEISSLLVAFLMLIASSWSVLIVRGEISFDPQRNTRSPKLPQIPIELTYLVCSIPRSDDAILLEFASSGAAHGLSQHSLRGVGKWLTEGAATLEAVVAGALSSKYKQTHKRSSRHKAQAIFCSNLRREDCWEAVVSS
jgi:hypothetical protein